VVFIIGTTLLYLIKKYIWFMTVGEFRWMKMRVFKKSIILSYKGINRISGVHASFYMPAQQPINEVKG
jgi:hypothetical protein